MKKLLFLITILLFVLTACGGRDLSNVKTSLYGHWVSEGEGDYYFDDGKYTYVSNEGKKTEYSYKVIEHDEVKNLLVIEEENKTEDTEFLFTKEITYLNDSREALEIIFDTSKMGSKKGNDTELQSFVKETIKSSMPEMVFEENLKYVDDKRKP